MAFDVARGVTVVFGGISDGYVKQSDTWEWDGDSWSKKTPADPEEDGNPVARYGPYMTYDMAREKVVMYRGSVGYKENNWSLWEWDGTSWDNRGPLAKNGGHDIPDARREPNFIYNPETTQSDLFFGYGEDSEVDVDYAHWHGTDWETWVPDNPQPEKRHSAAMCWVPNLNGGSYLLFGGSRYGWNDYLSDTWILKGETWSKPTMYDLYGDSNPAAGRHQLFYNTVKKRAYIFESGNIWRFVQFNPTAYEWNKVYSFKGDGTDPSGWHQIAWDPIRKRLVAIPEYINSGVVWEWNGSSWSSITIQDPEGDGNPSTSVHAFQPVYDATLGTVVIYGEYDDESEAWAWNGTSFRQLIYADPTDDGNPYVSDTAPASDSLRAELVLFGGGKTTAGYYQESDEHWLGEWGVLERPGHVLTVDFESAEHCAMPNFNQVTVQWVGGGTGHIPNSNGTQLYLWDEGQWLEVDDNNSGATSPTAIDWSSANAQQVNRIVVGDDQSIHFALLPTGANSVSNLAEVTTDYVEVELKYRLRADEDDYCEE
jgi:hypothetical protein